MTTKNTVSRETSNKKRELTNIIKQQTEYIEDMLSTRYNNEVVWYYLGDIVTMHKIRHAQKELQIYINRRKQLDNQ